MKCFYCGKEIDEDKDDKNIWNVAIEKPYVNLLFHKEPCLRTIKDKENEYLKENIDRVYEVANQTKFKKDEVKVKRK